MYIEASVPAPVIGEPTTNICDIPNNGDNTISVKSGVDAMLAETMSSPPASMLLLSRRGRDRSNGVRATILNDQVLCGMDVVFFYVADSIGVTAAPSIVYATVKGRNDGPNTLAAHPINTPL